MTLAKKDLVDERGAVHARLALGDNAVVEWQRRRVGGKFYLRSVAVDRHRRCGVLRCGGRLELGVLASSSGERGVDVVREQPRDPASSSGSEERGVGATRERPGEDAEVEESALS